MNISTFINISSDYFTGLFEHISSTGDIIIGGLFPVHKEGSREDVCGEFSEIPGYQYMEAMRYAVDQINNRSDILPGIRLGTVIYDTCRSPTMTADHTKDLIKLSLERKVNNTSEFAGVIGPFTSGNSIIVANFLRVFEIPQISYGGLTVELSDKSRYGYFFRTVPPDSFFAEGLARLLEHFRWNYVSIVYSTGKYPETGTEEVEKALSKRNICVATKHRLPRFPSERDFDEAIEMILVEEANAIVFVTIQRDSRGLLRAKERKSEAERLTIVASVSWSNRDDITKDLGPVAEGTITFGHLVGNNANFESYFRSINLSNYPRTHSRWFEEFWESRFQCSFGNLSNYSKKCTGKEDLSSEQMEIAPVRVVINAVYAMAYSLENMRKSLCPNVTGMCDEMKPLSRKMLKKFLENVTFPDSCFKWPIRFNRNNEVDGNYTVYNFQYSKSSVFSYVKVGNWTGQLQKDGDITGKLELNMFKFRWQNRGTTPNSTCSQDCEVGNVKQPRNDAPETCCWDCVTCKKYDVIYNDTCQPCPEGYAPNKNFSSCLKLEVKYINLGMPLAIFIAFFAFVGIITNLTAFGIFYLKRNHQLIKAMNIETCYIIFIGIFLIFITPIVFLAKPTQSICYARRFLLGSSFTICYAALLVKLRGIYKYTSTHENQLSKQQECTPFLGLKPYLVTAVSIDVIQVLWIVLLITRSTPKLQENFYIHTGEVLLECRLGSSVFVAYVVGSLILVSICTGYAFLTRNIQKNFRETMFISFTTYISNVLWLVLLVFFLNSKDSFTRQFLIAGVTLLIGWFTLLGLFAPAFYNLWKKEVFDNTSLIDWSNSAQNTVQRGQSQFRLFNTPQLNVRRATPVASTSTHQQEKVLNTKSDQVT